MILLDTHVLVWLDEGSNRLSRATIAMIDRALLEDRLGVSAMTFWEVAMLLNKNRLEMGQPVSVWRKNLLASGLKEIPVTGAIGVRAANLEDFHGDPTDRIITATALLHSALLITADSRILAWPSLEQKHDPAQ